MTLAWTLVWVLDLAHGVSCNLANGAFLAQKELLNTVAVIGPDDRKDRNSTNTPQDIEGAQGRIYCPLKPLKLDESGKLLDQKQLANSVKATATIAFEDDFALVNRHNFLKENGRPDLDPKKCYIQHISSGTFAPIIDALWPTYGDHSKNQFHNRDIAIVRFGKKLPAGTALKDDTFIIEESPNMNEKVTVVANYAENRRGNPAALTITNCKRYGLYKLADGTQSNIYGTDCDTGFGSSGGQAYVERKGNPKIIGIVSGQARIVPEGGQWSASELSTEIVKFDESLFETVNAMRARQSKSDPATNL